MPSHPQTLISLLYSLNVTLETIHRFFLPLFINAKPLLNRIFSSAQRIFMPPDPYHNFTPLFLL